VSPADSELGEGLSIRLPGINDVDMDLWSLAAAGGHLLVYERFGTKFDRRSSSDAAQGGGVYEIDPASGSVISSLLPDLHFAVIKIDARGEKLFGIDVASETWEGVRLVKIDRRSGHVDAVRELGSDIWNIDLADIQAELIPR